MESVKKLMAMGALLVSMSAVANGPFVERTKPSDLGTCSDPMLEFQKHNSLKGSGLSEVVKTMERFDVNQDGRVCFAEVMNVDAAKTLLFGQMDFNEDGCVTPREGKHYLEQQITAYWKKEYHYLDGNRSGTVTLLELQTRYGQAPEGGLSPQEILHEFDLDFDGEIRLPEYLQRNEEILTSLLKKDPSMSSVSPAPMKGLPTPTKTEETDTP